MTDITNKPSVASIARDNLKKGFSSPVAKISLAVGAVVVVGGVLLAGYMFRTNSQKGGVAKMGDLGVNVEVPRGETDAVTAAAVAAANNEKAAEASMRGGSFAGPYVYATERSAGPDSNPGMGDAAGVSSADIAPVMAALRKSAQEYDAADAAASGPVSTGNSSTGSTGGAKLSLADGYGWSPDDFSKVAGQLANVGMRTVSYESLPNGLLSRAAPVATPLGQASAAGDVRGNPLIAASVRDTGGALVARAGAICPALPETTLNTDYNVPVFVKLLDCGALTNSRLRGTIIRGPDDFTLRFTNVFFDPARRFKLVGTFDGVAVNVDKDGIPGVADSVNNHWFSRLASSSLLALAKTEKQFITSRGSTSVNTGTSTSISIEPLSDADKRDARLAAVLEGGLDVVTRDVAVGVNRQATMETPKNKLIAVQFLDDVKVTQID